MKYSELVLGTGLFLLGPSHASAADLKPQTTLTGHSEQVAGVVFSKDGKSLASVSYRFIDGEKRPNGELKIWDVASGKERLTRYGDWRFHSVAFSGDGSTLATGGEGTLRLWNTEDWKEQAVLRGHIGPVWSVAFSPDGKIVASGGADKTVRLWDAGSGKQRAVLKGHTGQVYAVAFSSGGRTLCSGSIDGEVRVWDIAAMRPQRPGRRLTEWLTSVAWRADGAVLALGSVTYDRGLGWSETGDLKLFDLATGRAKGTLTGHADYVYALAFSPDGKVLASGSHDQTVRLWNVATGQERATLRGHTGRVNAVAFTASGTLLASGSRDKAICIWNVAKLTSD